MNTLGSNADTIARLLQASSTGILVTTLVFSVIMIIATWRIFSKAGEHGWACLVPIYNAVVFFRITWGSGWYMLVACIPGIAYAALPSLVKSIPTYLLLSSIISIGSLIFSIMTIYKLSYVFGKGIGFFFGLLFLYPIFILILAFGNAEYGVRSKSISNNYDQFYGNSGNRYGDSYSPYADNNNSNSPYSASSNNYGSMNPYSSDNSQQTFDNSSYGYNGTANQGSQGGYNDSTKQGKPIGYNDDIDSMF